MQTGRISILLRCFILLTVCYVTTSNAEITLTTTAAKDYAELGHTLFFDTNLSKNRTQSCATCHDPERAFTDSRDNGVSGAVSLGDDGTSLGSRNAPTVTYASLSPVFHQDEDGRYIGGQFYDGRAATMAEQATKPLINPLEMGLPDLQAVVDRVRENPGYVNTFQVLFGDTILSEPDRLITAIGNSIAAFEETKLFAPFDSRYDRYLRGEYKLTAREELGRKLFFSTQINCSNCHLLNPTPGYTRETFTNYRYHNIGVPADTALHKQHSDVTRHTDNGLLEHPEINDPAQAGKFKVPTLRNIAVTAPYMHNGIFQDLHTVILFYSKYIVSNTDNRNNPETGKPWGEPVHAETMDMELLRQGQPLVDDSTDALIAFLETLTDKRYEPLLNR